MSILFIQLFPSPLCLDRLLDLVLCRLQIALELLSLSLCLTLGLLQALVIHVNSANLGSTNSEDQGVYSSERNVLGPNDKAPACPDGACAHESSVLGQREGFSGTSEIGGAGEDHAPFHYRCPGVKD